MVAKSMAQIMKSDPLAPRSVQDYLKPLADITRIDGLFRLGAGGKHQVREDAPLYSASTSTMAGGRMMVRLAALVLGSLMTSLPPTG